MSEEEAEGRAPTTGWREDTGLPFAQSPHGPGSRPGVLILESETAVREALGRWLQQNGFNVWLAGSEAEALVIYQQQQAALTFVMVDLQMRWVRHDPPASATGGPKAAADSRSRTLASLLDWLQRQFAACSGPDCRPCLT